MKAPSIGLVEVPEVALCDESGVNYHNLSQGIPMVSKQILISNLRAGGFDAQLVNLRDGDYEEEYAKINWGGKTLKKVMVGKKISGVDSNAYDAWGVTNNFTRQREAACMTIEHLAKTGKPVVAGGSDAIGVPEVYLKAGATAIVTDKSGGANWPIFDHVLGQPEREPLSGVLLADGTEHRKLSRSSNPEVWPIPSVDLAKQCLGKKHTYNDATALLPHGSVFVDLGCDRTCDFCQTPTYRLGYQRMSPQRALDWFAVQKEAGALGVQSHSDQFLGRVMFPEGRQELLDILNQLRDMEIPVSWPNGLELKKATLGRAIRPNSDMTPDEELIEAVWGQDGKVGCFYAYIPAERPVMGRESYRKLMPWQEHCEVMRAIVRSGLPRIAYGVIVGLPDDSHEDLLFLEEAISNLREELKEINPLLEFYVRSVSISPFPGTPQEQQIREAGLLQFEDPAILGSLWTPCANTHHLSYLEVWDWQNRLKEVGDKYTR